MCSWCIICGIVCRWIPSSFSWWYRGFLDVTYVQSLGAPKQTFWTWPKGPSTCPTSDEDKQNIHRVKKGRLKTVSPISSSSDFCLLLSPVSHAPPPLLNIKRNHNFTILFALPCANHYMDWTFKHPGRWFIHPRGRGVATNSMWTSLPNITKSDSNSVVLMKNWEELPNNRELS